MPKKKIQIPKIGQKVYVVFWNHITIEEVAWLGAESWIPYGFKYYYDEVQEIYYENDNFEHHYTEWYFTLEDAKESLLRQYPGHEIVQRREGFWEATDDYDDIKKR